MSCSGGRLALAASLVLIASCTVALAQGQPRPQLANPASVRCAELGGTLRLERRPDGGEYGVCLFVDNYQCEEWALFRDHQCVPMPAATSKDHKS